MYYVYYDTGIEAVISLRPWIIVDLTYSRVTSAHKTDGQTDRQQCAMRPPNA